MTTMLSERAVERARKNLQRSIDSILHAEERAFWGQYQVLLGQCAALLVGLDAAQTQTTPDALAVDAIAAMRNALETQGASLGAFLGSNRKRLLRLLIPLAQTIRAQRLQDDAQIEESRHAGMCPPNSKPACKLGLLGGLCGLPAGLYLPSAAGAPEPQVARFCLVSAQRLIASHDPVTFAPRRDYPAQVQERRYESDPAEQYKVRQIAESMQPALIFNTSPTITDGTPVVTEEGVVLGGNGRTLGVQLHYRNQRQAARDYLLTHAADFGFAAEQVRSFSDPVVVRVLGIPEGMTRAKRKQHLQQLVRQLNVALTQELDDRTGAVALARQLDEGVLEILASALDEDTSLAEYLSRRDSAALTQELLRAGILSQRNLSRYIGRDSGVYTDEGKRLVEKVLAAALVPDAGLLDLLGATIHQGLARAAPWLLAAANSGAEWDLRSAMQAAARDLGLLRAAGLRSVADFLSQGVLLKAESHASEVVTHAKVLLYALHELSAVKLGRLAQQFAIDARHNSSDQGSLFESERVLPAQALLHAARSVGLSLPAELVE